MSGRCAWEPWVRCLSSVLRDRPAKDGACCVTGREPPGALEDWTEEFTGGRPNNGTVHETEQLTATDISSNTVVVLVVDSLCPLLRFARKPRRGLGEPS